MTQRRPLPTKPIEPERADEPQPRGVAAAVILDWSIVAGATFLLAVALAQRGLNSRITAAAILLALLLVPLLTILGEAVRRGRAASRPWQIAAAVIVAIASTSGSLRDLRDLLHGQFPHSASPLLLVANLYIIWGLARPQTISWFARVTPAAARQRHGGLVLLIAILLSTIIGVVAVFINMAG